MEERICRTCGDIGEPAFRFCRTCGSEFHDEDLPLEQILILDLPDAGVIATATNGCSKVFYTVVVLFVVLPVLAELFLSPWRYRRNREPAREKACYANMRVLLGALEMYNMDHSIMKETLTHADAVDPNGVFLREQYLKSPITPPETFCSYSGYDLASSGRIGCTAHGTVE